MTFTSPPTPPSRSDDSATFVARADALLAWMPTHTDELNTFLATNLINYNTVSTTSVAIATGSKSFTVETGKLLQVGQFVVVASTASPSNYMYGQVTSYNSVSGALVVNVTSVGGSGTLAAWTISLSPVGAYLALSGGTLTGLLITLASATGTAGFRVPHGAAPTSPVNGDVWTTTAGLFARINGVTVQLAGVDGVTLTGLASYTAAIGGGTSTQELGFRYLPNQSKTANYTLVANDAGTMVNITTGGVAIPANATVAFPVGTMISIYNDSASSQNVTITTDTLRLAGTASTGTRALAQRGVMTLLKVKSTEWIASGPGVS